MSHANARLTFHGRKLLCQRVVEEGWRLGRAARAAGISRQTAGKWVARYLLEGEAGLYDRSSRPHRLLPRVSPKLTRRIVRSRQRERIGAHRISWKLGVPRSTVCVVLSRVGLSRIRDLDPPREPAERYEWPRPGDLLHLDTKKLGRIGEGGGKRFGGTRLKNRHRGIGWNALHLAVDDHSRLAYAEELPDEAKETAAAFAERALEFFAREGIQVRRILTDNGSCYRSRLFRTTLEEKGVELWHTRPYRPQTNGKAEAFVKTSCRSWAYARPYSNTAERIGSLTTFLHRYNELRPHGGLDGATPISRVRGQ